MTKYKGSIIWEKIKDFLMDEYTLEAIVELVVDFLKVLFIFFLMYKCVEGMCEIPIEEKKKEKEKQVWVKGNNYNYFKAFTFKNKEVKNESVR